MKKNDEPTNPESITQAIVDPTAKWGGVRDSRLRVWGSEFRVPGLGFIPIIQRNLTHHRTQAIVDPKAKKKPAKGKEPEVAEEVDRGV